MGLAGSENRVTEVRPRWGLVTDRVGPGSLFLFECQLRRGGGRLVDWREFALFPGETHDMRWYTLGLPPGPYEVFCRAEREGRFWLELWDGESQDCAEGCGFVFLESWSLE